MQSATTDTRALGVGHCVHVRRVVQDSATAESPSMAAAAPREASYRPAGPPETASHQHEDSACPEGSGSAGVWAQGPRASADLGYSPNSSDYYNIVVTTTTLRLSFSRTAGPFALELGDLESAA
jgi:hypothetical protein